MSMAQDTLRTLRSDDHYSRDSAPTNGGRSDPLAELARLIGQNDPFTDGQRQEPRAVRPPAAQPTSSQAAPDWLARTPAPSRQAAPAPHYDEQYSGRGHEGSDDQHDPRYDAQAYDQQGAYAQDGGQDPAYEYDSAYYDDGQLPPEGEEGYDEAP